MAGQTDVGFYHLTRSALEPALGRLLERVLENDLRAVVRASSAERVESLNRALWQFGRDSFLPHGTRSDGHVEEQPVFLTDGDENPNGSGVLVLVDGAEADPQSFDRCLYMFDGNDEQAVQRARDLWQRWRDQGMTLTYWQQGDRGWHKARSTAAEG
ncbi:MAG: DNA polymerase III subunit chi [Pseudomonadota bacterium]